MTVEMLKAKDNILEDVELKLTCNFKQLPFFVQQAVQSLVGQFAHNA